MNIFAFNLIEEQYSDQYVSFAYLHTPLFQNYPDEDITDAPCYASFSPIKPPSDELSFRIAEAYKDAGDILVETALSSNTAYELKYPILYTYRHAMEVYLKILLLPDKYDHTHQFLVLVEAIQAKYKADFPSWAKDRLEEFEEMDRLSDAFRYADSKNTNKKNRNIFEGQVLESEAPLYRQEMVLSIKQLRVVIEHICTGLKNKILDSNVPPACYS